jgi:threonine aldolase
MLRDLARGHAVGDRGIEQPRAIEVPADRLAAFKAHIEQHGIRMSIGYLPQIRMVTHLDIDDAGIERAIAAFRAFFR